MRYGLGSIIIIIVCAGCATIATPAITRTVTETLDGGVVREERVEVVAHDIDGREADAATIGGISWTSDGITIGASTYEGLRASIPPARTLLYIGAGCMVAAALAGWLTRSVVLAGLLAACGSGIVGLHYYPWIGAAVVGASALIGVVYVLYALRDRAQTSQAMRQTAAGLQRAKHLDADAWRRIAPLLAASQDESTKKQIRRMK